MGVECVLRAPVSVVAGGGDAGGGHQFCGRYPFAAGLGAAGGAVCGDGTDVPADCAEPGLRGRGVRLVGVGPDWHRCSDCVRGGDEYL